MSATENSTLLPPTTDNLHLSLVTLPSIVGGVLIFVILTVMVVALLLVVVCLRTVKRRKVANMRQPSKRISLAASSPLYALENSLWSEKPHYVATFDDSFEFPPSKLTLLNQLGEFLVLWVPKLTRLPWKSSRARVLIYTCSDLCKPVLIVTN